MEEKEPKLLIEASEPAIEPTTEKPGFFQRAFNRTKEAIRSVDEAITGRETFRRIEEQLQEHSQNYQELTNDLINKFESTQKEIETLYSRLDKEIEILVNAGNEQKSSFERSIAEVTKTANELQNTANELRKTANEAQETLSLAKENQQEMQKQASGHLARWNNESEGLKTDVRTLQSQLQQLQQSFQQFFITSIVGFIILTAILGYLFFR
jgi:chromosome segregation ATPase